jgi:hypothetical protein
MTVRKASVDPVCGLVRESGLIQDFGVGSPIVGAVKYGCMARPARLNDVKFGRILNAFASTELFWIYRKYTFIPNHRRLQSLIDLNLYLAITPSLGRASSIRMLSRNETLVRAGSGSLLLPRNQARLLIQEYPMWRRTYLPSFSLKGKVVLDVGAGAGETAYLFFEQGARKVVAVEVNPLLCRYLRANVRANEWDLEVHEEPFSVSHLSIPHDFAKIDCEGGEKELLAALSLGPCRVEMHPSIIGPKAASIVVERFGLRRLGGSLNAPIYGKN